MQEMNRVVPLHPHQKEALAELRRNHTSMEKAMEAESTVPMTIDGLKERLAQRITERERLIGHNTLRFVVQHIVHEETGLCHPFNTGEYLKLQRLIDWSRLASMGAPV